MTDDKITSIFKCQNIVPIENLTNPAANNGCATAGVYIFHKTNSAIFEIRFK